eukprot:scaffold2043_cov166-Amphora_coffeaeformis.AAC.2
MDCTSCETASSGISLAAAGKLSGGKSTDRSIVGQSGNRRSRESLESLTRAIHAAEEFGLSFRISPIFVSVIRDILGKTRVSFENFCLPEDPAS